jgi:hypothetical protein
LEAETATARAAAGRGADEEDEVDVDDEKRLFPLANEFKLEEFERELVEPVVAFAASASASTRLGTPLAAPSVVP